MISKSLHTQIIVRTILMLITAIATAYYISTGFKWLALLIGTVFILSQAFLLIKFLNESNRKIAYFFKAVKNEDYTLRFNEKTNTKSLRELNTSLNNLNRMLQDMHLKNQAQEKYYLEILKQADIGILTITFKGHILFSNNKAEKLLNYSPLNHVQQLQNINPNVYKLFEVIRPFKRKVVETTNEREKTTLSIKASNLTLNNQDLVLVVLQDIHKELDEKETDTWNKLIRVLTHEIMNTITPITSISDSILRNYQQPQEDGELSAKQKQSTLKGLQVISDQGKNLMNFVHSYRSLLKVPQPDRKIVEIEPFLGKIKHLIEEYNTNLFPIITVIRPQDLTLFIDEQQISHVLVNLCKNALQALANQNLGEIRIEAGQRDDNTKYILVKDNGPGIPPALLDEIFVPFFTTKEKGTGVGLSLSKQIMKLHGGTLEVRSIPQKETVFMLTFS